MRAAPSDLTLLDFGDEFHVVCPRCAQRALVRDRGQLPDPPPADGARVTLTCGHCGLSRLWEASEPGLLTAADVKRYPPGVVAMGGAVDWYFHLPLWLQTPCRGETLWAYNERHLSFLEDHVRALLREHARGQHGWRNQALRGRLPKWMQAARSRDEVLRCLAQLRARLAA